MPTDYTFRTDDLRAGDPGYEEYMASKGMTAYEPNYYLYNNFNDVSADLKAYDVANPIDWTATGTPATKTNVSDLLAAAETPASTPAATSEPAAQYTAATDYGIPATDAITVANVLTETPAFTPNASTLTATTSSPAASTYQASTAYSTDKKKKSKLPYDSVLFEAQTSEIL